MLEKASLPESVAGVVATAVVVGATDTTGTPGSWLVGIL